MAAYHTPSATFSNAASYLSTSTSAGRATNATKLELYGLFKYVTVAVKPTASKPRIFDMAGRAKWDAWNGMEAKYGSNGQEEAEKRYIELATEMGWTLVAEPAPKAAQPEEEEINFDSDEEDGKPRIRSGGNSGGGDAGGMGLSVSAMARPMEKWDDSIFGSTVAGDVWRLTSILETHPELDINQTDEYGYTPLHLACDRGHLEVVKLLLEKGADKSLKDPDEFTPLELAEVAGRSDIVALLSSSN
ncbi:hypothetical protein D9611_003112 [Ephemerocybe angulata]|uniref:ACB domain-containing protein n=1 Tax=Ephemerocybe angulata TaxID=980116 RepID=A0A8H5FHI8_9AGAR|nr:hypothetical protein D9611_003112 [Tulosesus angulatus]